MIKRAIAVTAALCMIYGSAMMPAADTGGEPVKAELTEAKDSKTKIRNSKTEPIKPIPAKEENNDTRRSEGDVEPDAGGHEAENNGDSPGGEPAGQLPDPTGSELEPEPEPSGSIPEENSGSEPEALVEDIGSTGDAEQDTAEYSWEGEVEEQVIVDSPEPAPEWEYYGTCRITHYCNCEICCGSWAGGPTASGEEPIPYWTVANGALPFGTHVLINGQEYCVTDRGVGGEEFDILVGSHDEAEARGLYYTDVYVRW